MSTLDAVVVATDHASVAEVCERIGAPVELTRSDHPSGTDRIAEVAERGAYADYDVIVNIQGDEPLLREEHLAAAVSLVRAGWAIGTCATPMGGAEGRSDPSVVKVARSETGQALYFSRAAIPYKRDAAPTSDELAAAPFLRHIGIYAYSRDALLAWVAQPPSPLERLEMLEQLRPLEAGVKIGVAVVGSADAGVDTPADAVRTESRLREMGFAPFTEPTGAS